MKSIKWIDKNRDTIHSEMYSNCHLTVKFLENYPDSKEETVYLITDEKVSTKSLFSKFDQLIDSFESFNIRFGTLENGSINDIQGLDGPCFILGSSRFLTQERTSRTLNNTVTISKKADSQACHLAYQRHFGTPKNHRSISLGALNKDIHQADTLIRNAHFINLNMDAIKKSDSHFPTSWSSGLTIEQACLMVRSAGLSSKNKSLCIDLGDEILNEDCTDILSLLFWYFLEGVKNRQLEDPENSNSQVYLVESEYFDEPIQFIKNTVTNRWWLKDPENGELKACSKQDYIDASKGTIPDVILSLNQL